jgi:hypothetical protein
MMTDDVGTVKVVAETVVAMTQNDQTGTDVVPVLVIPD